MTDTLLPSSSLLATSNPAANIANPNKAILNTLTSKQASPNALLGNASDIHQAAKKAADDFESVFIKTMLETMFSGISTDGPFGGGQGEKVFRSFLLDEYSKNVQATSSLGIADQVYRQIIEIQERALNEAALSTSNTTSKPPENKGL